MSFTAMPRNPCPLMRLGRLAELGIAYDPEDCVKLSQFTWNADGLGYVYTDTLYPRTFMHRLLMDLPPGRVPEVDHINRVRCDNRKANLRIVNRMQNMQNSGNYARNHQLPKGVYLKPNGKYQAGIRHNGVLLYLGTFSTIDEAVVARLAKERELWGN